MLSTIFILLVVIAKIRDNEAMSTKPYQVRIDNSQNRKNRQQLEEIIKYLNENTDTDIEQNENLEINADTGNYKVEEVMELAQKNYDTRVEYDLKTSETPVRLHVIKNPEILREYVKALRSRHSTSSESSDSSSDFDRMQRRNADYDNDRNDKDTNTNDSRENTKRNKSYMKGNINFKILRNRKEDSKRGHDIKDSDKYDDELKEFETKQTLKSSLQKKRSENIEDAWGVITTDQWKGNSKEMTDGIDKKTTRRRSDVKPKKSYKDFNPQKLMDWKKETEKYKQKKNSWENDDHSWKTTKKRKEYDSFESKPKKKIIYDYPKPKSNKKYNDDDWGQSKFTKKTTNAWDKLTTTRNSWVNSVKKKQTNREIYVKPSYVARNPVARYGGSSFHGRTPIPFVGKKGIYEDK